MAETKTFSIHKFNGENYQLWKRQMEIYMADNKLMPYVLGEVSRPAVSADAWLEKDRVAQAFLMRGLELEQLKYMADCTTAAQMWTRLQTVHAEKSDQSMQVLLDRFINCKMDAGEKMADYIARMTSLVQRLKDMDLEQKDPIIIAKILGSLPAKYDNIRTAWYTVPRADQTLERLTDHLINEETLLNLRSQNDNHSSEALLSSAKRNFKHRGTINSNKGGQNKEKSTRRPGKCNFCHVPGYWARECEKKKKEMQGSRNNESWAVQTQPPHEVQATDKAQLLMVDSYHYNYSMVESAWYADSGATEHMSFCRHWFKDYIQYPENTYQVRVGDGTLIYARGRGNVDVAANYADGRTVIHTIVDVLHVPKIKRNLLSIMKTSKRGIKVIFQEGGDRVIFQRNQELIMEGLRCNNLYRLNLEPVQTAEAQLAISVSPKMWHERLGHVNYQTLKQMRDRETVEDLQFKNTVDESEFCEGCAYGKQHRQPFPRTARRSTSYLSILFRP